MQLIINGKFKYIKNKKPNAIIFMIIPRVLHLAIIN